LPGFVGALFWIQKTEGAFSKPAEASADPDKTAFYKDSSGKFAIKGKVIINCLLEKEYKGSQS